LKLLHEEKSFIWLPEMKCDECLFSGDRFRRFADEAIGDDVFFIRELVFSLKLSIFTKWNELQFIGVSSMSYVFKKTDSYKRVKSTLLRL